METFYQDSKTSLGLDAYRMRNAEAIGNHWGSVSPASPSPHPGVDPVCPRAPPARAAGGRYFCPCVRQATDGHREMRVRLLSAKTQQSSNHLVRSSPQHKTRGQWD